MEGSTSGRRAYIHVDVYTHARAQDPMETGPPGTPSVCTVVNSYKESFNLELSGNEVYYTNALLLLIKIMLCSKLHCPKVLDCTSFSMRFGVRQGSSVQHLDSGFRVYGYLSLHSEFGGWGHLSLRSGLRVWGYVSLHHRVLAHKGVGCVGFSGICPFVQVKLLADRP